MIGIVTGVNSGVVVIDVDKRENGVEQWKQIVSLNGLPETFTVLTPSGGYHYYFKYDDRTATFHNGKIRGRGIDIRTTGGLIVFPGSKNHINNKYYTAINGWVISTNNPELQYVAIIATMPDWLFRLVQADQ
jgi:hypothetical protein